MWWKKKRRVPVAREHFKASTHFAAKSSKKNASPDITHNSRKSIIIASAFLIGGLLIIIIAAILLLFGLLSVKTKKNIILIRPTIGGNIDSFLFASINTKANNNLSLVSVMYPIELMPTSLVLEDKQIEQLQVIQASLQTGILIDEIWQVDSLQTTAQDQLSKQFFLDAWKQNGASNRSLAWWSVRFGVGNDKVVIDTIDTVAALADYDLSPAGSEIARQCSIAVVNTTKKSGVANFLTNYLEKKGVVVVRVTDNNSDLDTSRVVLAEESESCNEVVNILQYVQPEKTTVSVNQEVANTYRASAILFLGKDITELREEW